MHNNLGMLEMRQGNWDEALQNYLRGVELNAELNDVEATTELRLNIGVLLTEKGDLEEGRWHLEECLRAGQQIGHSFLEGQACQNLSYNFLQDRQYNRALEYAQRGEVIFRDVSGAENLIDLSLIKGEAYLGQSDFTRAQESLREMLARVDERGDDPGAILQRARADRLAGKIAYRQGQFEAARELLDRSAGKFTLMKTPLDLGRALAVQAALARETGDLAAAGSETSQARAIFAQLGARLDLAELDGTF